MEVRMTPRPALLALLWLLSSVLILDPAASMEVTIQNPFNTVFLLQPVTFRCNYQTTGILPPVIIWKYKSYCRSYQADAFNHSSQESQINNQLQQNNHTYNNPSVECPDNARTVRIVAAKQRNTVTLGEFYHGRHITITNVADLSIKHTVSGDSGVYYCTVISPQDLQGNNEAYAQLVVLGFNSWADPPKMPVCSKSSTTFPPRWRRRRRYLMKPLGS